MKIDLDKLERVARAAEFDEWQWRPANIDIIEGKENGQIVLAGEDLLCSVSDRAHIAAASPPVVLALIAYIRELEVIVKDYAASLAGEGCDHQAEAIRAILEKESMPAWLTSKMLEDPCE